MAHAILEASTQKQSSTTPAEKVLDQNVVWRAAETAGRARPAQIVVVHARTTKAVRPKGLTRERRSSAAGAGSCGPSTGHDRRQRAASLVLPRSKTFQTENSPRARPEWRSQKHGEYDASRAHI